MLDLDPHYFHLQVVQKSIGVIGLIDVGCVVDSRAGADLHVLNICVRLQGQSMSNVLSTLQKL